MAFIPKFNNKVWVNNSLGLPPVHVSPDVCLTDASAAELVQLLQQSGLTVTQYPADPNAFAPTGSPFSYSQQVPWLTIQDPAATPDILKTISANFNAAYLAMWWVRIPADNATALMYCRREIQAGLAEKWQESQ